VGGIAADEEDAGAIGIGDVGVGEKDGLEEPREISLTMR